MSPGKGRSWCIELPGPQTTARNWKTCGDSQVVSCTVFSAQPVVWPRLFVPVAKPCVPPSVGSGVMTPFCHRKPKQRLPRPVALGKKNPQLHFSLYGSGSFDCAIPLTIPRTFFTGQSTALFGPPSVSRSVSTPFRHRVACLDWLPSRLERPATQPRSLMLNPTLEVPPSWSRLSRW